MDPVIVRDYNPLWPRLFDALRARIATALEGLADAIEHVGSTAVPGLAAKPIIDMDALLATDTGLQLAIARLGDIGYRHEGDLGVTGREAFRAPAGDCQHHLYVCLPSTPPTRTTSHFATTCGPTGERRTPTPR